MDQKNRMIYSMAVILLIFAALLVSFGRVLFQLDTPDVLLPSTEVNQPGSSGVPGQSPSGPDQIVAVTPQTVQSVIATLERTDSYYRELSIEQFWSTGSSVTTVRTWTDRGWSHSYQQLPNGAGRHDLVGPDTAYYWYDGSSRYGSVPADDRSADLAQRLPTYETVLDLDPDSITNAGYEPKGEIPCVFVESTDVESETVKQYWVSVDSGLLICAELRHQDEVIYRMTAFQPMQSPCPASALFQLPDGTVLHTP